MGIFSKIFNIDTKSSSRIILTLFGIKIKFFRPGYKKQAEEYINFEGDVTQLPKATEALRKVQLANLKMLIIFDRLCKENGIEYWLDFGNLLGAVRHKGFIPGTTILMSVSCAKTAKNSTICTKTVSPDIRICILITTTMARTNVC